MASEAHKGVGKNWAKKAQKADPVGFLNPLRDLIAQAHGDTVSLSLKVIYTPDDTLVFKSTPSPWLKTEARSDKHSCARKNAPQTPNCYH